MKKLHLAILFLTALGACKQEGETPVPPQIQRTETGTVPSRACYSFVSKGDTFSLKLTIADTKVLGTLNYNFAQKDDNTGTLEGTNENKTIFADYTFISEGKKSIREVAFKKEGRAYVEGFGEMQEVNGKMVFKDRTAVVFDGSVRYHSVPCPR